MPAAIENHEREKNAAIREKVYQALLVDPIDLSQNALDSISLDGSRASPGGESHLDGYVVCCLFPRDDPEEKADRAFCQRADVFATTVEQRADEALFFEPE